MAMLKLLRRMAVEGITVHGFRSTFRDWASDSANAPREVAKMSWRRRWGYDVEWAYARSDLLEEKGRRPTSGMSRGGSYPSTDFGRVLQDVFGILGTQASVRNPAQRAWSN